MWFPRLEWEIEARTARIEARTREMEANVYKMQLRAREAELEARMKAKEVELESLRNELAKPMAPAWYRDCRPDSIDLNIFILRYAFVFINMFTTCKHASPS